MSAMKFSFVIVLFASLTSLSSAEKLTLVREGRPVATVVTDETPPLVVQLAVAELNHHIKKITGTALPVVDEKTQVKGIRVLVGESAATQKLNLKNDDFQRQEYLVETRGNDLILMGYDSTETGEMDYQKSGVWKGFSFFTPMGTVYAVYDFLERACGIRWYLPLDLGTVIPKQRTLTVQPLVLRRKPWARYRWVGTWRPIPKSLYHWDIIDPENRKGIKRLPKRELCLYWLRQRMGGYPFNANHAFNTWPRRFKKTHPEYFAKDKNGNPRYNQLNYTSEAVVGQVVKDILACRQGKRRDENGTRRFSSGLGNVFPIVPMDGRGWSADIESQKLLVDKPTRSIGGFNVNKASRYIFQFVNRVAHRMMKLDKEATIAALAYDGYFFPPEEMTFPDNVSIMVCKQQVKARNQKLDQPYWASLKEWRKKVEHLYVWEYYNFPEWRKMNVFPGLVPRRIGRDMKKLHQIGIEGEFIELNTAKGFPPVEWWLLNPAMQHINFYFTLKLLNSMEKPIENLLDEYYRLFYGPAEEPMRKFFTKIEDTYMDQNLLPDSGSPSGLNSEESWTVYCPPEKLKEFKKFIERAKGLAHDKHPYQERVELMDKAIYQFMKKSSDRYHGK